MTNEEKGLEHKDYYKIIELIYQDSHESIKIIRDDINLINSRLTLLIGFNATFASFLVKLPKQTFIQIEVQEITKTTELYPHAKQLVSLLLDIINWCLLVKPVIALLLAISIILAILSVLTTTTTIILFPKIILEKSKNMSELEFRKAIIDNRDETVKRLQRLMSKKAVYWKWGLLTLGGAGIFTIIDILSNIDTLID